MISKIHLILFLSFICMPYFSWADDTITQSSTGNSSPVINSQGDVNINYGTNQNKSMQFSKEKTLKIIDNLDLNYEEIFDYKWLEANPEYDYRILLINYRSKNLGGLFEGSSVMFTDLFQINQDGSNVRLYHEEMFELQASKKAEVFFTKKNYYIILYSIEGSGGILYGDIYKINDINEIIFYKKIEDINGAPEDISTGTLSKVNKKIILIAGKKFVLNEDENGELYFNIVSSNQPKYPELGVRNNILQIKSCDPNNPIIIFNNKKLDGKKIKDISNQDAFSTNSIKITRQDDIILLYDQAIYKILLNTEMMAWDQEKNSPYEKIKTLKESGKTDLDIRCHADSDSIYINFEIGS